MYNQQLHEIEMLGTFQYTIKYLNVEIHDEHWVISI